MLQKYRYTRSFTLNNCYLAFTTHHSLAGLTNKTTEIPQALAAMSELPKKPCDTCGRLFASKHMKEHQKTHNKDEKDNCPYCNLPFAGRRLREHRQKCPGNPNPPPGRAQTLVMEIMDRWSRTCPKFKCHFKSLSELDQQDKALWGDRLPSIQPAITDKTGCELYLLFLSHFNKDKRVEISKGSHRVDLPKSKAERYEEYAQIMWKALDKQEDMGMDSADALFNIYLDNVCAQVPAAILNRHEIYGHPTPPQIGFNITPAGTYTDLHHGMFHEHL